MPHFSFDQIKHSLAALRRVHPFFGITFLVCKQDGLPIGRAISYPIAQRETEFLDQYYRPAGRSQSWYRVFRTSDSEKNWIETRKYPSSGLQSIRTRGDFENVFVHPKGSNKWGWHTDYVARLSRNLKGGRIPLFDLAVWLYREYEWRYGTQPSDIVDKFIQDFRLIQAELDQLFDVPLQHSFDVASPFQDRRITWEELQTVTGHPTDLPPDEGGTLEYLELRGLGPARQLAFEPAERLNLITGDNGLGKTFILECAWWALTNQWAGLAAYPRQDAKRSEPQITFKISGTSQRQQVKYDWQNPLLPWPSPKDRRTIPGLLIYARVDGSFAVWDPAKHYWSLGRDTRKAKALVFTKEQIWTGLEGDFEGRSTVFINGLLRDWITWQSKPDKYPFETFKKVLRRLSPQDIGPLLPGEPIRLPSDAREMPTLRHAYGDVPIIHAAAGVQRIAAMAYLIVWTWYEHQSQSSLLRRQSERRMVVLVDEIEAHLHPKWQRLILPALLQVQQDLAESLNIQFVIATHSPLVMASAEPIFNESTDKLFNLSLQDGNVALAEIPFIRQGTTNAWLTSEVFDMDGPRNDSADKAIARAKELQLMDDPPTEEVQSISAELSRLLAADDPFWPRWKYFAEQHGASL
jgi:hypothetical protein